MTAGFSSELGRLLFLATLYSIEQTLCSTYFRIVRIAVGRAEAAGASFVMYDVPHVRRLRTHRSRGSGQVVHV